MPSAKNNYDFNGYDTEYQTPYGNDWQYYNSNEVYPNSNEHESQPQCYMGEVLGGQSNNYVNNNDVTYNQNVVNNNSIIDYNQNNVINKNMFNSLKNEKNTNGGAFPQI